MKLKLGLATLFLFSLQSYATENTALISQGEYLARAADCMACHTPDSGKPFAGGVKFALPIGTIYSTNISPDKQQGIGDYSESEFSRAVREGVRKDGQRLYPAMPYNAYAKLSDQDIHALYTYFMQGVKAVDQPNSGNDIPWYLAARWPLRIWNAINAPNPTNSATSTSDSDPIKRGAWLVEGPGHCGACHTPRGWMMQEKGLTAASESYLSGAEIEGWFAPSLRQLPYDAEQTALILKTGHNATSAITGPMSSVITHSSQYLTDSDAKAIGLYLDSIRIEKNQRPAALQVSLTDPDKNYLRYCSTCHGKEGQGTPNVIPSLQNNLLVMADNPASLIQVIAQGAQTPQTLGQLSWSMPGYHHVLNDEQLADLTNYVRGRFAGKEEKVTASQVKTFLATH
ncbi:c-type cytochrome [Rosenbergiella sp. S61]|uniref:C-type cytochrome n=1 Tax=Rosenbergiella gaditana TaxID=2726987 RepID=A0ABS5SWD6_9GAMM|nr:cytochrome c [Rosenbergiella gaditana]MBT0723088.1 c-type cytochrome [Rosenbergiella gaditana]